MEIPMKSQEDLRNLLKSKTVRKLQGSEAVRDRYSSGRFAEREDILSKVLRRDD